MRIDDAGPRTWLLAGIAAWCLALWLLALFGMGGRVSPLPADPALVRALPLLPPSAPERLGPLAQYAEFATRPLFHRSRRPQPFFLQGNQGEQVREFDFVLSSVMITPRLRMAILQPAQGGESIRLKVGEAPASMASWTLVDVQPRSASFAGPEGPRTLELRVYDGIGGQAPTARAQLPGAAPGARPGPPVPVPVASPQVTGASAPTPGPQPVADGESGMATGADAASNGPDLTTEQQMDAIRKRIEARRAQLRQSGQSPNPPNNTQ